MQQLLQILYSFSYKRFRDIPQLLIYSIITFFPLFFSIILILEFIYSFTFLRNV